MRVFILIFPLALFFQNLRAHAGTWMPLTNQAPGPIGVMLLLSDGTVMAELNDDNSVLGPTWYRLAPDNTGSYKNGTWSTVDPTVPTISDMGDTRLFFQSQVLKDGRVFVSGGEYGSGKTTAEVYDPLTDTWTPTPPAGQNFLDAESEILPDGRILVAPVVPNPYLGTVIYDPVTNTWTAGPLTHGVQDEASWVKLPDDSILTIDLGSTYAERYIPSQNQWIGDARVPVSLYDNFDFEIGPAVLLPNGNAIFFGASGHTAIYTPSGSTAPGSWVAGPDLPTINGTIQSMPDAPAAMLRDGKVLIVTSDIPASPQDYPSTSSFFEYDYISNTFTRVTSPDGGFTSPNAPYQFTFLSLPDGTVLASRFDNQLYIYTPSGAQLDANKPVINSITLNPDGSFHVVGTGLNGNSEGATYGDDVQVNTNYPIISLTSSNGNVSYARSFNWSSTSVMTGTTIVTTEFNIPAGLTSGTYAVRAIANGIKSDPVPFFFDPIRVSLPANVPEGVTVTGTVTLPFTSGSNVTVTLTSSRPARATVSATTTVLAGQTTATFSVTAVDDSIVNGNQAVTIIASATGYQTGSTKITVRDNDTANEPQIISGLNVRAVINQAFSYRIIATNSANSYNATNLPAGLSVNPSTGFITGTATVLGTNSVTLYAYNSLSTGTSGYGTATLTIIVGPPPPVITSTAAITGTAGQPLAYQVVATGTPSSYTAVGLPPGLNIDYYTGLISGTPAHISSGSAVLNAINAGGTGSATIPYNIQPIVFTAGSFNGLIRGPSDTYQDTGFLSINVTAMGKITGYVVMSGKKYTIKGQFDAGGDFAMPLPRSGNQVPMSLQLHYTPNGISGTAGDTTFKSTVQADPALTGTAVPAGKYTLRIFSNDFNAPRGHGIATITVAPDGVLTAAGALPDGSAFSQRAYLTPGGMWDFFALTPHQGVAFGGVLFQSGTSPISGNILWLRPTATGTTSLPYIAAGSPYVPPAPNTNAIALPNGSATLSLSGGDLSSPLTHSFPISLKNTTPSSGGFSLKIQASTGLFTGSFLDPTTHKATPYRGVLDQLNDRGDGFFNSSGASGDVGLTPN